MLRKRDTTYFGVVWEFELLAIQNESGGAHSFHPLKRGGKQ